MSAPTRIRIAAGGVVGKQQPSQCRSYFLSNQPPTHSQPTSSQPPPPTKSSTTKVSGASSSPASVANTTINKRSTSTLPETKPRNLPETWFNPNNNIQTPAKSQSSSDEIRPPDGPGGLNKPPDERKVKLGKTLRILQAHLPTILQSPLPTSILSPQISLHLFPSTHPHLPTVRGRVAYIAALWTAPLAWNRLPIIGNVRLEILSERMVDRPLYKPPSQNRRIGAYPEELIVRWRTIGNAKNWGLSFINGSGSEAGSATKGVRETADKKGTTTTTEYKAPVGDAEPSAGRDNSKKSEFTGLFIFEFDGEGRILSHTIEHAQQDGEVEKGVGATVVGLTDWLLGGMKGAREGEGGTCPAFTARQADEAGGEVR
ncbi:hypothetical protein GE21DRAFT_3551 [Neurospora crassa]|uniref:Chromosome transmission fidelity protein 4 n=1 Tax=Neurospora crassa (strain ATCC 24698 / 74-OR23-1A / CBS 708.71 / DSM 1257 / FGSC 987) TaxID=367110 RepID=F5HGU3_NEUCR|nr:hypothetical protein NCU08476 [Neurospora crassa OR74A]EAA33909.3 hypothetical protein NCU08476 [Neurospora crassa OR74A]KHE78304.1 hypothetical protein GE21DRAFT_3551 [Neurospora crassa]|eukprot:XP_963145.3 hypothetical protein NCU08476 [Neurospora crassa OR74A]